MTFVLQDQTVIDLDTSPENFLIPEDFRFEQHDPNNVALIGLHRNQAPADLDKHNYELDDLMSELENMNFSILGYLGDIK